MEAFDLTNLNIIFLLHINSDSPSKNVFMFNFLCSPKGSVIENTPLSTDLFQI